MASWPGSAKGDNTLTTPPPPVPATPQEPVSISPKLESLDFTSSEYGRFIPIVFGSDKLTGNVFWYSGFQEHTFTREETKYFYKTVSFAIGLCEGPIAGILRIWVGDKLIVDNSADVDESGVMQPNTAGAILTSTVDLISPDSPLVGLADAQRLTGIRVFNGDETQLPEGLMVETEGWEDLPAYRGLAFVLLENFIVQESSIPNVYVEVLANTTGLTPRLYYDLSTPQDKFDRIRASDIAYAPPYDQFVVYGYDNSGNGDPAGGTGLVFVSASDLSELWQHEFLKTYNNTSFYGGGAGLYFTSTGHIIHPQQDGNQGIVHVINAVTGNIDATLGPGGGLGSHSMTTGFGAPGASTVFVAPGPDGRLTDYFFCCGFINDSYGIARVDRNNQISMVSVNNGYFTGRQSRRALTYVTPPDVAEAKPTFVDGISSAGTHVFIFCSGFGISGSETTQIDVYRVTVDNSPVSPETPYPAFVGSIDLNLISGQGFAHDIACAAIDYTDYCFVLWIESRTDRIIKWSPWTGEVLWSVPVSLPANELKYNISPILTSGTLGLIQSDRSVISIDLQTGTKTTLIADLSTQDLPTIGSNCQFYNGLENSLTYLTGTAGKRITKIFLDRISRSNVAVADIVVDLLRRVGFRADQIDVEDLQALSLDGYTIDTRKNLRTIFSELSQVFRFDVIESNGVVLYKTRGSSSIETIDKKWLADVDEDGWFKETKDVDFARYRKLDLTYRDIDREYEQNVQSVILPQYVNSQLDMNAAIDVSVPLVLKSDDAKRLAEILLYSKTIYASQYEGKLPPRYMTLEPADVVTFNLGGETVTVRLREVTIGADHEVRFIGSREDPDIYNDTVNLFGNIGRFPGSELPTVQPLVEAYLLPIPFRTESEAQSTTTRYLLYLALLNNRPGTPTTDDITIIVNDGEETTFAFAPDTFPTWGYVKTPPDTVTAWSSTDYRSTLRVNMVSTSGAALGSAPSKLDLLNSPTMNLAIVGGELIQFETVIDEGNGQYLLTGLHRALHGTDTAVAHGVGERFILLGDNTGALDTGSIMSVSLRLGNSPTKDVQVLVVSNNPFQTAPVQTFEALNLKPWTVNHVKGEMDGDDIALTWQRRSRYGGAWEDTDEAVPLTDGATPLYEVMLVKDPDNFDASAGTGYLRKMTLTENTYTYTLAEQTADGFDIENDILYVFVQQTNSVTGQDTGYGVLARVLLR